MYDSWRGDLYPEGLAKRRWLERYAERFDTVEVNSTFYRLASRDAVARWVEQTPESFVFAAKASRYLTHMKKLRDLGQGIARYYERIEPLVAAGKLGPVVWQLPPTLQRDDERCSPGRSRKCQRAATASSFVIPAGSRRTSMHCYANARSRW